MKNLILTASRVIFRLNIFMLLAFGIRASGQVSTANVIGTVEDSSGAHLPDARLKLINALTGAENDSMTDRVGAFGLSGVLPGAYTLRIDRGGFATTQVKGITLNVGDTKKFLIRMKIGSVSESVTVDASGLTLNTSDASVSTVVDRSFVGNIPLNGRSFQDLISMTPGIVTQSPQAVGTGITGTGDFSVNGQRPDANEFFVDGISANVNSGLGENQSQLAATGSAAGLTALGTTHALVSIDALQEFRVLTSSYSAEYGRTPGGQFTFLTRSGSNTIHGSFYNYFRTNFFDANDWFGHATSENKPSPFQQNDYGATFGSPLLLPGVYDGHDRTFFFVSYEGLKLTQNPPETYEYVPAYAVRTTPPTALQPVWSAFPYPIEPEILNKDGQPTGLAPEYFDTDALPSHVNSTSIRMDHRLSPKLSMFARYGETPSVSQSRKLFSLSTSDVNVQTFSIGAIAELDTTRSNDIRFGYARSRSAMDTKTKGTSFEPAVNVNLPSALGVPASATTSSADVYVHIDGVGSTETNTGYAQNNLDQWNLRDTFTLQRAEHHLRLGIDQRRINATYVPPAMSAEAVFFDREGMIANEVSNLIIRRNNPATVVINQFSAFLQDEWRVTKSLTLSPGLRWEISPPPTGEHGQDAYTVTGDLTAPATLTLAPRGTPLWHTDWKALAPRLGAAWIAHDVPGRELVLRAGGGIFFDEANRSALKAFNGLGFVATTQSRDVSLPASPAQFDFSASAVEPYTNATAFLFPPSLKLPYSVQWNVGLEKALGKDQALTISYLGAVGHRLLQEQRKYLQPFNPEFGNISYFPSGLSSNYQALQIKFQRSMSHGLQALASYTWAHGLDYGSTSPVYQLSYGSSDLDIRHNVEAAISWQLPKPSGNAAKRALLGGWAVDGRLMARTGFPITLFGNLSLDPVTGERIYSGVNLVPNRTFYLYGHEYPGGRMVNGGSNASDPAFTRPDGMEGNAPRNPVRGFGAIQENIAIQRQFRVYERMELQFRAETFNMSNHPNFGFVDPFITDALFGQPTKVLNQSFGPNGSLYQQGGPRSVQLSLRLSF